MTDPATARRAEFSRLERLHYRLLGHWPRSVVDRRLAAYDREVAIAARRLQRLFREDAP